jgi:hypothetical protein
VYAVTIRLCCASVGGSLPLDEARRQIRAAARPEDGFQHVYVQGSICGADIVLFLVADGLAVAEQTAARLIARAQAAGLAGCRPFTCQVELIVPFAEAALPPDRAPG